MTEQTKSGNKRRYAPIEGETNLQEYLKTGMVYVVRSFKNEGIPQLFKSTGHTTKNMMKARRRAEQLVAEWRLKHMAGELGKKQWKVSEVVDEILRKYTPKQRPGTQENHKLYLGKKVKARFGHRRIDSLVLSDLEDWIEEDRNKPSLIPLRNGKTKKLPPRRTFMDYAKALNLLLTYARERNYSKNMTVFPNPDTEYRQVLQQKRRLEEKTGRRILAADEREILELKSSRVMSREEIDRFYETLEGDTRDQFILAFTCFLRLREALEAPFSEINLETGLWTLPPERVKTGSKTGEGRSFYVSPEALEVIQRRYGKHSKRSRFLFPGWAIVDGKKAKGVDKPVNSNKSAWAKAKETAGIKERLRWHDIRHTALTFAILGDPSLPEKERKEQRQDPFLVAKYAGVSLKTIEAVYLHTEGEQTKSVGLANQFRPNRIQTKISESSQNVR
jgi:integrase